MNEQLDLFGFAPSQYIIKKPIRLIELFAGIGAQSKALEVLKANFESYKIAEWSKESIKAYTYIHHYEEIKNCNDKEINSLSGISRNYSEPMTKEQINNLKEDEKILLTNCKKITHNLIDISKVKGEDLNIVDTDKYEYVLTYSYPCQDLSLAGKLGGMEEDSGTRSSLLWQVCRILNECKEIGNLPNTLLMENVPQVIGTKNKSSFHKFMKRLEDLGYKNFVKVLNAKDFYIPQNRQRCFMVSILTKEDVFSFPNKMKLDYYLLDFLDKEVDEKYYLSDDKIIQIQNWKGFENPLEDIDPTRVVSTLTTHCGKDSNGMQLVLVPEKTKKGYAKAKVGDGIYINRPHQKRGVVQKGMIQTIKTSCGDICVVVDDNSMKKILCNKLIESGKVREGDVIRHSYSKNRIEEIDNGKYRKENTIYNGDAYELIKQIPDKSIDLIYTDIPYLYANGGDGNSELSKRIRAKKQSIKDISIGIDYSIFEEFKRVLKKLNLFIWCSKKQIIDILNYFAKYNFEILVWCKTNPQPATNNIWLPDIEYCLYFREKGVKLNDGYELKSKWYVGAINQRDKKLYNHPTIKPLDLVERHIKETTKVGGGCVRCIFRKWNNSSSL